MNNLFEEGKTMSRGFEVVSKFEDKNIKLPERKTESIIIKEEFINDCCL